MTAVIVVAAIAVVGAVVARVTWRRPGDERHSIQSHQQTLETLRSMADRRPGFRPTSPEPAPPANGTRSRPAPPAAASGGSGAVRSNPATSRSTGAVPSRSTTGRTGVVRAPVPAAGNGHSDKDLVFVDDAPATAGGPEPMIRTSSFPLAKGLPGRGHRRSRPFGSARRTRLGPVVAAVGVLALVAGVAVALAPSHHAPPRRTADRSPRTAARGGHHRTTTTTTAPQMHPTSSTATTADYSVPSTGYTVALQASGLCWVEATSASTGNVVWTGTLQSGQAHSISGTGTMILRLGAANDIAVSLDGEPVVFPAAFQSPFDMTFTTT